MNMYVIEYFSVKLHKLCVSLKVICVSLNVKLRMIKVHCEGNCLFTCNILRLKCMN